MGQVKEKTTRTLNPYEAKKILVEGNKRFVTGNLSNKDLSSNKRISLCINGQSPIAAVLTCSDSRVAPEIIFDQSLGDLFVIRNAGNIADIITLGSIEYAVENLGVSLIIILAHEKCGAVKATIDGKKVSSNLKSIINTIAPSLKKVQLAHKDKGLEQIQSEVENENAKQSAKVLLKSSIIKKLIISGELNILSAKYYLETGEVKFL